VDFLVSAGILGQAEGMQAKRQRAAGIGYSPWDPVPQVSTNAVRRSSHAGDLAEQARHSAAHQTALPQAGGAGENTSFSR